MAYVTIPKDLSKVQSKVLFGLTKRQMICFGTAALVGVPLFFLAKASLGTTTAALCMILVMLPFFLFAMYEKNGQPLEVFLGHLIQNKFIRPKVRIYQTNSTYSSIPNEPVWLFSMSPNYLETLGVTINADALVAAKNGTRLYLIPSTLPDGEKEQISGWLQERDTKSLSDGDIQTAFTQNPTFLFIEYEPSQSFFTWTTNDRSSIETDMPIIYVATPQNMKYTETESLKASGFNGYIKFADMQTAMKYTNTDILSNYNLTDNDLKFVDVHNYIDGLQKELGTTLMWFGIVFVMLMLILIGLLLTLATVFRIVNQEKINVKKFMGFSFLQMYRKPIILLSILIILELIAMLVIGSKFGLLLVLMVSAIQVIIFVKYMTHNEIKNVLIAFKGE